MVYHLKTLFFHPSEIRAFYKLPFCHERKKYNDDINYDMIQTFHDKMKEFDDFFSSDELKEKFLGKNKAKYEYQPIVTNEREEINCEGENGALNLYRPPYLNLKIDLDYNTKSVQFLYHTIGIILIAQEIR